MKTIYDILEGLLDIDDIDTGLASSIAAKPWNQLLATLLDARNDRDAQKALSFDRLREYVEDFAVACNLKSTKNWPIRSSWEQAPDFVLVSDNAIIIKTEVSVLLYFWSDDHVSAWGVKGHYINYYSKHRLSDDLKDLGDRFIKRGNKRYAHMPFEIDKDAVFELGKIQHVYKIPAGTLDEKFYTIHGIYDSGWENWPRVMQTGLKE